MLIKREQSMRENYAQENDKLVKENSELATRLNRAESLVDRHERERHADAENRVSKAQLAEVAFVNCLNDYILFSAPRQRRTNAKRDRQFGETPEE
jgi:hypothetical protein